MIACLLYLEYAFKLPDREVVFASVEMAGTALPEPGPRIASENW